MSKPRRPFDVEGLVRTLSQPRRLVDRLALAVALGPPLSKRGPGPPRRWRRRIPGIAGLKTGR